MPISLNQYRFYQGKNNRKMEDASKRNQKFFHSENKIEKNEYLTIEKDTIDIRKIINNTFNSTNTPILKQEVITNAKFSTLFLISLITQNVCYSDVFYQKESTTDLINDEEGLVPYVPQNNPYHEKYSFETKDSNNRIKATTDESSIFDQINSGFKLLEKYDPLKFPSAEAAPLPAEESLIKKNDSQDSRIEITEENEKRKFISELIKNWISNGKLTLDESEDMELILWEQAKEFPICIFRIDNQDPSKYRKTRAQIPKYDVVSADNLAARCTTEEEVLDLQGKTRFQELLFQAQRADNPFRQIYDGRPDHIPAGWERGVATGLNIGVNIITLGIPALIGGLIASKKREEFHNLKGDRECAEYFRNVIRSIVLTSSGDGGKNYKVGGGVSNLPKNLGTFPKAAKATPQRPIPVELIGKLKKPQKSTFYTQNINSKIETGYVLEVKSPNYIGHPILLKPTEVSNEFIAYHLDRPDLPEKRVVLDEGNESWRYDDEYDKSKISVAVYQTENRVEVSGEFYNLHKNSAGEYEIFVNKDSGITDLIPVYKEPLSDKWHLSKDNGRSAFTREQTEILNNFHEDITKDFEYIPRENYNPQYYGNCKVYFKQQKDDYYGYTLGMFVEMNGKLVPTRLTEHQGSGALYEIYDVKNPSNRGYSIESDGERWLFERETSKNIPQCFEHLISEKAFDKNIDKNQLSAPNNMGLRTDSKGYKYIKIKNNFVRTIEIKSNNYFIKDGINNYTFKFNDDSGSFSLIRKEDNISYLNSCGLLGRAKRSPCGTTTVEIQHLEHLRYRLNPDEYPVSTKIENQQDAVGRLKLFYDDEYLKDSVYGPEENLPELISFYNNNELYNEMHFSEFFALNDYGKTGYKKINKEKLNPTGNLELKRNCDYLELSLRHLSELQSDDESLIEGVELFRGEVRNFADINSLSENDIISRDLFLSTTTEEENVEGFIVSEPDDLDKDKVNVIYKIEEALPYSGAKLDHVMNDGENEYLFLPKTKFQVTKIKYNQRNKLFEINLKQIPESYNEFSSRLTNLVMQIKPIEVDLDSIVNR